MKQISTCMIRTVLTAVLVSGSLSVSVQAQDSTTKPDNSAQNKRQGDTADNQPNAKADRLLAAEVRKAIVADKDLSTYAHNVKIIVRDGVVILKGPVKSDDEKQKVKSDALSASNQAKVIDQLTVKK